MAQQFREYRSVNDLPDWVKMITGGLAGSVAELATIPIDTAKVRLQIQKPDPQTGLYKYKGLLNTTSTIFREEGFLSLFKGLVAGFQRQMVFASIRIGLYEPVRNLYCGKDFQGDPPLLKKIAAGLTTGAVGILVANPTDVDGNLPADQRRYANVREAYKKIYSSEGLPGYWRGVVPNMLRNSIINCAELATFDQARQMILNAKLMQDGFWCHVVSSSIAGFVAATVGQPVDLIKTRVMNQKQGIGECIMKAVKNDGLLSFYNGYGANAGRIVSWNMVMFVSLGQIRMYIYDNFYKTKQY